MFFRRLKKRKFFDASVSYFFEFGRSAGLKDSDIEAALPRIEDVAAILAQAFKSNLRPIDGGIILADFAVRDAYARRRNSELMSDIFANIVDTQDGNEHARQIPHEIIGAWADGSVSIAEKIQMKAFDFGVRLGSAILPSEGHIGEIMKDFLTPHPDFEKS